MTKPNYTRGDLIGDTPPMDGSPFYSTLTLGVSYPRKIEHGNVYAWIGGVWQTTCHIGYPPYHEAVEVPTVEPKTAAEARAWMVANPGAMVVRERDRDQFRFSPLEMAFEVLQEGRAWRLSQPRGGAFLPLAGAWDAAPDLPDPQDLKGDALEKLLEQAKAYKMSEAQSEAQRRSFAFGNTNIENGRITRETIDRAAEKLKDGAWDVVPNPQDLIGLKGDALGRALRGHPRTVAAEVFVPILGETYLVRGGDLGYIPRRYSDDFRLGAPYVWRSNDKCTGVLLGDGVPLSLRVED